jgi:hypothetical protein
MTSIHVQGVVGEDGKLRLEVPCGLPPGPAEVVVVVGGTNASERNRRWSDFYGVARDLWADEDPQEYINRLRDEWER